VTSPPSPRPSDVQHTPFAGDKNALTDAEVELILAAEVAAFEEMAAAFDARYPELVATLEAARGTGRS
jgi:hypothetical protein